jgi:hypothetical protein
VKVWFRFAKNRDAEQAKVLLLAELKKDSTRLDILQEVGKACYYTRDYGNAYKYYQQFLTLREQQKMDIFKHEDLNIAYVFAKMGDHKGAARLAQGYKTYAENDKSIYKHLHLAFCYAYEGRDKEAIEQLKLFSKEDNYQFWILFYNLDPMIDRLKNDPEFKIVMRNVETKFWETHKNFRKTLEAKELL